MARRGSGETGLVISKARRPASADPAPDYTRRMDALVELVDHCTAAKDSADSLGERLLAYLLAMAIQEARAAMRATVVSPGAPDMRAH